MSVVNKPTVVLPSIIKMGLFEQLSELDLLQSMYPDPGELRVDQEVVHELRIAQDDLKCTSHYTPLCYDINLSLDQIKFEINIKLTVNYPSQLPEIFVRCDSIGRRELANINAKLMHYIETTSLGEVCIYSVLMWIQDNHRSFNYITKPKVETAECKEKLTRLWIYSHHICSKIKRKNILQLNSQYNCNGFMVPGKPGIICIEGNKEDCAEIWLKIKSMKWKMIKLIGQEVCESPAFTNFNEIAFTKTENQHLDTNKFYEYLNSVNCAYIYKEYFGVDKHAWPIA